MRLITTLSVHLTIKKNLLGIETWSAFSDKEEFIRLFIDDASSEQLFMIRKITEKSINAPDALAMFQFYFEDELHEMLHEALIHQAGN